LGPGAGRESREAQATEAGEAEKPAQQNLINIFSRKSEKECVASDIEEETHGEESRIAQKRQGFWGKRVISQHGGILSMKSEEDRDTRNRTHQKKRTNHRLPAPEKGRGACSVRRDLIGGGGCLRRNGILSIGRKRKNLGKPNRFERVHSGGGFPTSRTPAQIWLPHFLEKGGKEKERTKKNCNPNARLDAEAAVERARYVPGRVGRRTQQN